MTQVEHITARESNCRKATSNFSPRRFWHCRHCTAFDMTKEGRAKRISGITQVRTSQHLIVDSERAGELLSRNLCPTDGHPAVTLIKLNRQEINSMDLNGNGKTTSSACAVAND